MMMIMTILMMLMIMFMMIDDDGEVDVVRVYDDDKMCWLVCLPCRVPPLLCHSRLQLHGYPLNTFPHKKNVIVES